MLSCIYIIIHVDSRAFFKVIFYLFLFVLRGNRKAEDLDQV